MGAVTGLQEDGTLGVWVAIIAVLGGLAIPISAIYFSYKEKMARILAEQGTKLPPNVVAELRALREEVATLRETTTRFDMSFDAALTRLESRVDSVENQQATETQGERASYTPVKPTQETAEVQRVGQGR